MVQHLAASRLSYADNLKVALVAGVVVAHVTMAFAALEGAWVLDETPVREPLLSLLDLAALVGVLFGMALFFMLAGMFTPASLEHKDLGRFVVDRCVRLLVPVVAFVLLMAPVVEYVDTSNEGWSRGFGAFAMTTWTHWPQPPGPTWFLVVLLAFSLVYGVARSLRPRRRLGRSPLTVRTLAVTAGLVAVASYLLRFLVPFGEELWHVTAGRAPAWVAGFTLGVLGGERGWFSPVDPRLAKVARRVAWTGMATVALVVAIVTGSPGGVDRFAGHGTWESAVLAGLEGVVMVSASVWLVDLFQRRADRSGPLARLLARAAYAAFFVHQVVLVAVVLATRLVPWPPEAKYVAAVVVGVVASFGLGALLLRLPGVSRVL